MRNTVRQLIAELKLTERRLAETMDLRDELVKTRTKLRAALSDYNGNYIIDGKLCVVDRDGEVFVAKLTSPDTVL